MLAALIPILAPILNRVLDSALPDPEAKAKAQADLLTALAQSDLAQMKVNEAEAGHASIFVAGWRPFIGWVGGAALAYVFIIRPMADWALQIWYPGVVPPPLVVTDILELVLALLGLGGLRTFEKMKGVTR